MGREMVTTILEADDEASVSIDLTRRVRETTVRNSAGTEVVVRKAPLSIMLEVEQVRGNDVVTLFEHFSMVSLCWRVDTV